MSPVWAYYHYKASVFVKLSTACQMWQREKDMVGGRDSAGFRLFVDKLCNCSVL